MITMKVASARFQRAVVVCMMILPNGHALLIIIFQKIDDDAKSPAVLRQIVAPERI